MASFEEKKSPTAADITSEPPSLTDESQHSLVATWTPEEERRIARKIDFIVMPLLIVAFAGLQFDRANIGNALTDNFLNDTGVSQDQYNVGQQLLSLGIVLWEIPSNMLLYRIGPSIWLSAQIITWGLVATLQAFQHGVGAYMATRFLLGSAEAGFIPAGLYTITRWYKRDETSKRFSWYFVGNLVAQALSGLIAYGILHMRGICGLGGWQWLFILEGLFTVAVGLVFIALFPRSPSHPISLFRLRLFSERESEIMIQRVLLDDPTKQASHKAITWPEIKRTLTNWRLLPHVLLTITGLSPVNTLWSYGPTLTRSMGFGRLVSNAYVSIGAWGQLITTIVWGTAADWLSIRGPIVLFGGFLWWLFLLVTRLEIHNRNGHARFAILMVAYAFSSNWHPVNGSWMALNARSPGERSITLAVMIMSANLSGIIGYQYFQASDKPLYPVGWTAIVCVASVMLLCMIWANFQYWYLNRRLAAKGSTVRYYQ